MPEQNAPFDPDTRAMDETQEDELGEDRDDEVFHDPAIALRIAGWAKTASWIVLVLGAVMIVVRVLSDLDNIRAGLDAFPGQAIYSLLYGIGANTITWGVNFLMLQAISQGLYLFMDIERNTYLARKRDERISARG